MLFNDLGRRLTTVPFMLCATACCASMSLTACGSDPVVYRHGPAKAAPVGGAESEYSLKVYVTDKHGRRLVKIPPLDRAVHKPQSKKKPKVDRVDGLGLLSRVPATQAGVPDSFSERLAIISTGSGGGTNTEDMDRDLYGYSGWTLLMAAVQSCLRTTPQYSSFSLVAQLMPWYDQSAGPFRGFYVFDTNGAFSSEYVDNCDLQLAAEEVLLCTADRLAEVANTLGKVVWQTALPDGEGENQEVTIDIPPQATRDKFIARDLAMNALAHLAKLNSLRPSSWSSVPADKTCDDAYSQLANATDEVDGGGWSGTLPATIGDYFPPDDIPETETALLDPSDVHSLTNQHRVGAARLKRKAALFSAAGRLMKSLIEESVDADLAGAEQKRAGSGDPAEGTKAFWGVDASDPYNSMRHVLSVLYGRMEMGPYIPDDPNFGVWDPGGQTPYDPAYEPECNAVPSTELVNQIPSHQAREVIVPPTTEGQARALSVLQSSGIVVMRQNYEAYLEEDEHIDVVEKQLMLQTEAATGQEAIGELARKSWSRLSASDKKYALDQVYAAVELMSEYSSASLRERAQWAGLPVRDASEGTLDSDLQAANGFVLDGGIPLEILSVDLTATLGKAQAKTACDVIHGGEWDRTIDQRIATQGAFEVGVVLRRALSHMKGLTEDTGDADLSRQLESGASELAAWVGPGELTFWLWDGGTALDLRLTGMQPSDVGAADWDEVQERLVLVNGPYYVAECVAGLRGERYCPSDLADHTFGASTIGTGPCSADIADGFAKGYSCWKGSFGGLTDPAGNPIYVVMEPSSTQLGSVIAGILPRDGEGRATVVSRFRNELASRAFAMKEPAYRGTTCSGVTDFLDQQRYCLDMPRHMFVPLANELTSEGGKAEDSWSHYLAVAKEAAAKADELGRQMIELGIARDLRAEAAVEEVGNLCGAFPNVEDISFKNNVPETEVNAAVKACLGEAKKDVVFLTNDTYLGREQDLWNDYCSGTAEDRQPPFCEKEPAEITHAGLNFSEAVEPPTAEDPCAATVAARPVESTAGTWTLDAAAFAQVARADYASQLKLREAMQRLYMMQWDDGWQLGLRGSDELLMADLNALPTNNEDVWPACHEANDPGHPCTERAEWLGALFRADGSYLAGSTLWEADVALQVEDTLYWLGVLAGEIPAGVLTKPVPLVDSTWNGGALAPIAVAYTRDGMQQEGTLNLYHLNLIGGSGLNASDAAALDNAWVPDSASFPRFEILGPSWLNEVRTASTDGLFHFFASNSPITFREQLGNPTTGERGFGTRADLGTWLSLLAQTDGNELLLAGTRAEVPDVLNHEWDTYEGRIAVNPPCGFAFAKTNEFTPSNWATESLVVDTPSCADGLGDPTGVLGLPDHLKISCVNHGFLAPHACSPADRMQLFWSVRPAPSGSGALLQRAARALALSCHLLHREIVLAEGELPPNVDTVEDLLRLEIWVARAAEAADQALVKLPLFNVPDRVLQDFAEGRVGSGTIGQGKHGDLVIQYGNALRAIHDAWVNLGSGFRQLNGAINGARISIEASGLARDQQLIDIARQQLEIHRQMALTEVDEAQAMFNMTVGVGSAIVSLNPFGALGAAGSAVFDLKKSQINTEYWQSMAEQLESEPALAAAIYQNGVAKALADLSRESPALYGAIDGALSALRSAVADAHLAANGLAGNEQSARYALAKAAGADFVNASGGQDDALVPLHMNTVYNRAFAVTEQRYKDALDRAKRAAYIARLAIEQRLGVRLENLDSALGPVDAPALWAEDLCSLTGINYEDLKTTDSNAVGGGAFDYAAFADRYIGDYVDKLGEFVEFYNIDNPFKEGTDSAIISVREDVGHSGTQCFAESRNLLYESERLFSRGTPEGDESRLGWRTSPCNTTACLEVMPGDALMNAEGGVPVPVEGPEGMGAASWLLTTERGDRDEGDGSVPSAIVYQTVDLEAGTVYVLSWWDLARDPEGGQYEDDDGPPPYRAVVYSDEWSVAATDIFTPSNNDDGSWGSRRVMPFTVVESGTYHVAFKGASTDQPGASLAIANVQLEVLQDVSEASAYEPTGRSRSVLSTECKTMGKEGWQQAFRRVCGGDGCYYELKDSIVIDTEAINHGQTSLVGKLAPGNYNYRNGTVALNLVGTGVIDCGDDDRMSCYGSGYIAYDLEHQASNVKVLDNGQDVTCFDFRTGSIRGGKALATERFLTLPMSSSDKGLIEQSGFLKGELAGRPLDGTYRLRIKETPALRWENLEDIQLVFNYGYWSAVDVANAL